MTESEAKVREALRKNFLFKALEESEIDALLGEVQLRRYDEGAFIVKEDDDADSLFLVVEGTVNVMKASGQFLAALGSTGFFGEMGLFVEGSKRTAHCIAASTTVCAIVDKNALDRYCDARPASGLKILRAITRALSDRLRATSADLAMAMSTRVRPQAEVTSIVEAARAKKKQGETG
jgi:CRP-like cAMP-binding protein